MRYDSQSQTFTCVSSGGPATTVSWMRDGSTLLADGTTYETSQILTESSTATYENRLSIVSKSDSLSGRYTCSVVNRGGSDSQERDQISKRILSMLIELIYLGFYTKWNSHCCVRYL